MAKYDQLLRFLEDKLDDDDLTNVKTFLDEIDPNNSPLAGDARLPRRARIALDRMMPSVRRDVARAITGSGAGAARREAEGMKSYAERFPHSGRLRTGL